MLGVRLVSKDAKGKKDYNENTRYCKKIYIKQGKTAQFQTLLNSRLVFRRDNMKNNEKTGANLSFIMTIIVMIIKKIVKSKAIKRELILG